MMFFSVFLQWLKRVDDPKFMSNNTIVISKQPFIILKSSEIGSGSDGAYLNKFVIHHVTEADGGMYICLAANTMGFSWRSAHLIVRSSKSQTLNPHLLHPYHPTTPSSLHSCWQVCCNMTRPSFSLLLLFNRAPWEPLLLHDWPQQPESSSGDRRPGRDPSPCPNHRLPLLPAPPEDAVSSRGHSEWSSL